MHIIDSQGLGGAENLLLNTVSELKEYNHILVYLNNTKDSLLESYKDVTIYKLPLHNNLFILPCCFKLRRIIRKHNVNIVHAHLWKSVLLARLATPKGVRLLFTLHSMMGKDAFIGSKLRLWVEKLTYKKNQEVIAVSKAAQEDYSQFINVRGKQHVLYNFVDDKFFAGPKEMKTTLNFQLVAVGNLKEAKNYGYLLETVSQVKGIDYELDIYGEGPQAKALQKIIEKKNIPVKLKGKEKKIETILHQYDLFVMASSYEGYGLALAEAMASGLPVLISDIPVFREVAGEAAFYFSLTDVSDFARQLTLIYDLKQKGDLTAWSNRSKARAREIASKEIYFKKLKSIYNPA